MQELFSSSNLIILLCAICFIFFILVLFLWVGLTGKEEKVNELQEAHRKMLRSFNELDEQAKLIVKTDLELSRAQEELEKRLNGLNVLQRVSRKISQALNENEIFEKLQTSLFEDLGFTRALVVANNEHHSPEVRIVVGWDTAQIKLKVSELFQDEAIKNVLHEGRPLSSINASRKIKERIIQLFESEHYVLAPIMSQTGILGIVFVGNRLDAPAVTVGDEELVAVLAAQIGQSIENAQLFDKVFRSSQELEIKVKDRTKQLVTALAQVEEINRKKTEFLSAVSHELRTPLTSIKGYAAILIAGKIGNIPEAVKERLSRINTHSDNLVSLINNLLDITRIESGKVEMHFALQPTKTIIDNIADLLAPQLTAKEIKLDLQLSSDVPEIFIDASQAERVFINLLSNAVKFTPKMGTINLSVSLVSEPEGYALFRVIDSGIGIGPADMEKLFTEFFRAENEVNQSVKGTGLGLVLAKDIVQAHRGKIWVTSHVGVGTTFSFTLPMSKLAFEKNKSVIVA